MSATRSRFSNSNGRHRTVGGSDNLTATIVLIVGSAISAFLFMANPTLPTFECYRLVNAAVLLWIPMVVVLGFLNAEPTEFGFTQGDRRIGIGFTVIGIAVMALIVWFASRRPEFQQYYQSLLEQPLVKVNYAFSPYGRPQINWQGMVYYELMMGFYFFCWEFFFRGFLLFGLAKSNILGSWGAIVVQTIPYTLLHWSLTASASKPLPEIASAFFGGLALGFIATRTKSFYYGFVIHWTVALGMDLLVLMPYLRHLQ